MPADESWLCTNPACRKVVIVPVERAGVTAPRCECGALLKKRYVSPAIRYLQFLRLDDPILTEPSSSGKVCE